MDLNTNLYIKVKGKVYPKIIGISEHLFGQSCPLLGDLPNLKCHLDNCIYSCEEAALEVLIFQSSVIP